MKEFKNLNHQEILLVETLKNLDYKFNKAGGREVEVSKFEMKLPKELNDTLQELIDMLRKHYRGLNGHVLTKTSFITALLMYALDRVADENGKIKPKNLYLTTHDQLFRSILKDGVPTYAGLRSEYLDNDVVEKDYEKYRKHKGNRKGTKRNRKQKETAEK